MSNEFEKHARSIANSSGFPLQIRVANIAESTSIWRVFLEEHPWQSDNTKYEGFLDLVLIKTSSEYKRDDAMVIECKRVRETAWVFLIPDPQPNQRYHARLWESKYACIEGKWNKFGWVDRTADPSSFESQFCAIPGQEKGRRTLLERIAAELIEATEALALQEKRHAPADYDFYRLYIPVIVTTAELIISHFEPESVSLKDGCLPPDSVFETVPYIRFRKSLATNLASSLGRDIQEMHEMTERTVFIINAQRVQDFLRVLDIRER